MQQLTFIICAALSMGTLAGHASTQTPHGKLYPPNSSRPSLELCELKTYGERPDQEAAAAQTTFFQKETAQIWTELTVRNLLCGIRDHTYCLTFRYIYENERVIACHSTQCHIPKSWPYAQQMDTLAWSKPKQWPLGNYRVEMWIENLCFATHQFAIFHEDERAAMFEEEIVIEKRVEIVDEEDDALEMEFEEDFDFDTEVELEEEKPLKHAGQRWLDLPQTPKRDPSKKHAGYLRLNLP